MQCNDNDNAVSLGNKMHTTFDAQASSEVLCCIYWKIITLQLSPASTTVTKQYFTITTVNTSVTTVLLRCPSPCHCLVDNKYKISASFTITHRQKRKLNLSSLNRLKGLNCCSFGLEPIFRDGTEPEPGKNELNPNRTRSQNFGLFPISTNIRPTPWVPDRRLAGQV